MDLPLGKKLEVLTTVYALIGLTLIGFSYTGLMLLDSVHAYVGAVGTWSRNQNNAAYHLVRYTQAREERSYREFEKSIAVPKSLGVMRIELEKPVYDKALLAKAIMEGGIHPDDIEPIIFMFRWFRSASFFSDAVAIWKRGDQLVQQLDAIAKELRREVLARRSSPATIQGLHEEIFKINSELSDLENDFSESVTHAAHVTRQILVYVATFAVLLLTLTGYLAHRFFPRHLLGNISRLRLGTELVTAGDFHHKIPVRTADELGQLAGAFNAMTMRLDTAMLEIEDRNNRVRNLLEREKEFTANISHELRTPLTSVKTSCELIAHDPGLSVESQARLARIVLAVNRMNELMTSLLLLAREHTPSRIEPVSVRACLQEVVKVYSDKLRERSIELKTQVAADATINLDRNALYLVLSNLIKNAMKHTENGTITVKYLNRQLSVSDTGVGIAAEDLPNLFKRFYRSSSGAPRDSGFGLGLSIVKSVCDHHGWKISVTSTLGSGATFTITIPD
jgi:signal transduction histidine kinase